MTDQPKHAKAETKAGADVPRAGQSRHSVDRGDRRFSDPAGASVKLGCEAGTLHLSRIFDTNVKSPIDQGFKPLWRSVPAASIAVGKV